MDFWLTMSMTKWSNTILLPNLCVLSVCAHEIKLLNSQKFNNMQNFKSITLKLSTLASVPIFDPLFEAVICSATIVYPVHSSLKLYMDRHPPTRLFELAKTFLLV